MVIRTPAQRRRLSLDRKRQRAGLITGERSLMEQRSNRAEIRNPILALPALRKVRALPEPARLAIAELLKEISEDAQERSVRAWYRNKAPMAAYWKSVAVYARHIHRALRK
jgi:hypothetical protein